MAPRVSTPVTSCFTRHAALLSDITMALFAQTARSLAGMMAPRVSTLVTPCSIGLTRRLSDVTGTHFHVAEKFVDGYLLKYPVYSREELEGVTITHRPTENLTDRLAHKAVQGLRKLSDIFTGTNPNERQYTTRFIFLETVAGVPGMVAGVHRHLRSLRQMSRDYGWINSLLQEAENERMHLLAWLKVREPSLTVRFLVAGAQAGFFTGYFAAYMVAPTFCHRFVGYLEEEAVKTYTHFSEDYRAGRLPAFTDVPAPQLAKDYWHLGEDATICDLALACRADEAYHRDHNHAFADVDQHAPNPTIEIPVNEVN
eukprot:TRINITY_DN1915_c0_g4_i1.p1 TRINITY_DN1915_c0_g4~~TRINITY_DN1915_c0_g4_i1.p1  ORF type:complete len:313 (+),score=93.35 TRINITY_DN1915_c0_g4_i1:2-940(+)